MSSKKRRRKPKGAKIEKPDTPSIPDGAGKRSPLLRFGLLFTFSCAVIYGILNVLPLDYLKPINEHTSWTLGQALRIAGMDVSVHGPVVTAKGFAVSVIPECTPLFAVGIYLSFLMAYPAPARLKLTGLAAGIPCLWAANLFRLALVFIAGQYDRNLFDAVHVYFGQVFTACLVFAACTTWVKFARIGNHPENSLRSPVVFLVRLAVSSTIVFLIWLHINPHYVSLVDWCMLTGFSLFGHRLAVSRNLEVYYYTFNIVVFTSLFLATRSVDWSRKARVFAPGLCIIFLFHLLYRMCNALITAYHMLTFVTVGLLISTTGQYLLPVLLWVVLVRHGIMPGKAPDNATP